MTDEELEPLLKSAKEVDTFEFGDREGDEYFDATLYKTEDGRHFRYVGSAGMGAAVMPHSGEWLTDKEVKHWKKFS
jgi:hypothetical protein